MLFPLTFPFVVLFSSDTVLSLTTPSKQKQKQFIRIIVSFVDVITLVTKVLRLFYIQLAASHLGSRGFAKGGIITSSITYPAKKMGRDRKFLRINGKIGKIRKKNFNRGGFFVFGRIGGVPPPRN